MKTKSQNSGQTIVEVLIVTAIVAMLLVGLLSLNTTTQKTTNQSRKIAQATQYNTQAINWIRSKREELGWQNFYEELDSDTSTNNLTYCLQTLSDFEGLANAGCSSNDTIPNTNFLRELSLTLQTDAVQATITTSWEEQQTRQIQNTFKLARWK